jgi:hypothetical protein
VTSTKETCLAEMRASFEELTAAVDAIPAERLTEVGVTEEWSARDMLAPSEADDANDDTTNAWVVAHARTLPVEAILAEFRWAHRRLMEAVEACEEADLDDPNRFPFTKGRTLISIVPDQCQGHHRQHLPQLRRMSASP